jgi:opacity protein-like surface antigen
VRRTTALVTLTLTTALLGAAAPSRASGLDLRLGGFFPRAESNLFSDAAQLYFVDPKKDFRGFTGGIEYNTRLVDNVELGLSIDGFDKTFDTSYRDYLHPDGNEIRQTLKLDIVPVGLTLRFVPTGRRVPVAPYLAVGADLFYWRWREYGEFIDFRDATNPIVADSFRSDGFTAGFHVAGGLRVRVSNDFSVTAEGRYQRAKAKMGGDFKATDPGFDNEIDLSGWSATVGVHVRF